MIAAAARAFANLNVRKESKTMIRGPFLPFTWLLTESNSSDGGALAALTTSLQTHAHLQARCQQLNFKFFPILFLHFSWA